MDKQLQDRDEMQEEELYALLDKAMETERLCVSEDLIQKTLQRAAEQTEPKVVSFETVKKRRFSMVKYAGAAAAVFVLVVGARAVGREKFTTDQVRMNAPEAVGGRTTNGTDKAEAYLTDGMTDVESDMPKEFNYSTSDMASEPETEAMDVPEVSKENVPSATSKGGETAMPGVSLVLSDRLTEALTGSGWTPKDSVGECWEFVTREENWEESLLRVLRAAESLEEGLPESGTYRYVLGGKNGKYTVVSPDPLDVIVRFETEQGVVWGLLGDGASFYTE